MTSDRPALLGGDALRPQGEPTWPPRDPAVDAVFQELANSGGWGRYEGPYCEALEDRLPQLHDVAHVRLTASGTAAVEIALRALGVKEGDEVLMAGWDFKANFADVVALGATPVLVDVRPDNAMIDVQSIDAAISPQCRAVIASHLHGCVVDMPALREVCDRRGVPILEDVCQMPLAEVYNKPAGTWGDVGVMSFGGSKTLSAGRGGAIITNDATHRPTNAAARLARQPAFTTLRDASRGRASTAGPIRRAACQAARIRHLAQECIRDHRRSNDVSAISRTTRLLQSCLLV